MPAIWWKRKTLDDGSVTILPHTPGPMHRAVVWASVVLILLLYATFAVRLIERTNLEPQRQDQKHNMRRALVAREHINPDYSRGITKAFTQWLPHDTDGVVAPLWPWLAARFAEPGHLITEESFARDTPQDHNFFAKGKYLNVWISGIFLLGLGWWASRRFSVLGTVNLLLLAGFGALLPRAVYFQPEPLFYLFFFLSWVAALRLLEKNSLWRHAQFGVLCGLAYLAKTSIEPLILVWFGVSGYRFIRACVIKEENANWHCRDHFLGMICFAFAYFAVIGPMLSHNKERFGSLFHSYPRYWMWMDNFDQEGYRWMQEHPNASTLRAIPPDKIPNRANYIKAHPWPEWGYRLSDGTYEKLAQFFAPKPEFKKPKDGWKRLLDLRGAYLGGCAVLLILAACYAGSRDRAYFQDGPAVPPESGTRFLFVLGTFVAYSLAYGWYHVIGRGERFMLGLYVPLVFSILWAAEHLQRWADRRGGGGWFFRWTYTGIHIAMLGSILWRLWTLHQDFGNSKHGVWFDPDVL